MRTTAFKKNRQKLKYTKEENYGRCKYCVCKDGYVAEKKEGRKYFSCVESKMNKTPKMNRMNEDEQDEQEPEVGLDEEVIKQRRY